MVRHPSPSCEFPGADCPPPGSPVPFPGAEASKALLVFGPSFPYASCQAKSSSGRTFRFREPVNLDRHAHVGVAPTRGGHLHVGDELGWRSPRGRSPPPAPRTPSPCGRCRSHPGCGAIAASRRTPALDVLQRPKRHLAFPSIESHRPWGARAWCLPTWHCSRSSCAPAAGTPPACGSKSCHGTGPPSRQRSRAQTENAGVAYDPSPQVRTRPVLVGRLVWSSFK